MVCLKIKKIYKTKMTAFWSLLQKSGPRANLCSLTMEKMEKKKEKKNLKNARGIGGVGSDGAWALNLKYSIDQI